MKKISFSTLAFEVTRKCNIACDHCCRGDARNKSMTKETVDAILDHISGISSLIITGGEPTLNVPIIRYIVDQLKAREISIEGFDITTNGVIFSLPLVHTLIDLYAMSDYGEEYCSMSMSQDQHHYNQDPGALKFYSALRFFNPEARKKPITHYIYEGRAKDNCYEGRIEKQESWEVNLYDFDYSVDNMVYIAANGNVVSSCDLSYEHADRVKVGNVLKEPLIDIIERQYQSLMKEPAMV